MTMGPLILVDLTLFRTEPQFPPNSFLVVRESDDDEDDEDRKKGPDDLFGGK